MTSVYRRKPSSKIKYMSKTANVDAASGNNDWTPPPTRYCVPFCALLNVYKLFYSEIALGSKNNPSSQAGLLLLMPKASVAGLVDDEIVSIKNEIVKDETSADEAAAKLKWYIFISAVFGYNMTMFYSCIENPADDFKENPLTMYIIFYSYFHVIDILIASGFQRSRSPRVLHHKWHRMHMCQALRLQQLKRSTFIFKLSFAIFFLLIVRLCHLEPFISPVMKRSNKVKSQKGYQQCHFMTWLSSFWLVLVLGVRR